MARKKHWKIAFDRARIDVTLEVERGRVIGFAVNLSYLTKGAKYDVIRYDTAHGYMHVHRFWISPEFIGRPMGEVFEEVYADIKENWARYIELFKQEVLGHD